MASAAKEDGGEAEEPFADISEVFSKKLHLGRRHRAVNSSRSSGGNRWSLKSAKQTVRNQVWSCLMGKRSQCLKKYPPSCFGKIPHFQGCFEAAELVSQMSEFITASVVKVNPSLAQMHLRSLVVRRGKTLLVPATSLSPLEPNGGGAFYFRLDREMLRYNPAPKSGRFKGRPLEVTKKTASQCGVPIGLDDWSLLKVDLFVVGSVAVDVNGVRLGKGMGYAELEWAILYELGAVDPEKTVVLTTVHEDQVLVNRMSPKSFMGPHDLPVDVIVTPTRIINVRKRLPKPSVGVLWDLLSDETLEQIPILQELKARKTLAAGQAGGTASSGDGSNPDGSNPVPAHGRGILFKDKAFL